MESLNDAKVKAGQLCGQMKVDVIIYLDPNDKTNYKVKPAYLCNGHKSVCIARYEGSNIQFYTNEGKKSDTIALAEVKAEAVEKKTEPKSGKGSGGAKFATSANVD